MNVSSPIWDSLASSYSFDIFVTDVSKCTVQTRGRDPIFAEDVSGVGSLFIEASVKYFIHPLNLQHFIRNSRHTLNADRIEGGLSDHLRVNWIPLTVRVINGLFEIQWGAHSVDRTVQIPGEMPIPESGERARRRQKIRESRLRLAAAKLNAQQLVAAYYEKYGGATLSDSSLTSDSDDS